MQPCGIKPLKPIFEGFLGFPYMERISLPDINACHACAREDSLARIDSGLERPHFH